MSRRALKDAKWARIEPLVPGKKGGRRGTDNRIFVDASLWLARGAAPWRDLQPELGHWKSVYTRFRRWSRDEVWESLFKVLCTDPDFEYVLIDVVPLERRRHCLSDQWRDNGEGSARFMPMRPLKRGA